MSLREQIHEHGDHAWKSRMKDWFILPCSHVPKRPEGITPEELRAHGPDATHGWMSIDGDVYDVTQFMQYHPGGELIMKKYLGRDATSAFAHHHAHFKAKVAVPELLVGPLLPEGQLPLVMAAVREEHVVPQQADDKKDREEEGGDDARQGHEMNFEDRESLEDLFKQLAAEGAATLTDTEFADFLNLTGVTDEEKQLTLARLAQLREELLVMGKDVPDGVTKEMFVSLF